MRPLSSRMLGLAVLGSFLLHASTKDAAHLQEMLWLCHVATALMAVGLIAGWHRLVAAAFLMHLGFGTVSWLVDVLVTRWTLPSSVLIHLIPLVAGTLEVRRKGWPSGLVLPSWLFFSAWVLGSRYVTEPALNINLAHAAWGPFAGVMGGVWLAGAFNSGAMLVGFLLTDALLRRLLRPRTLAVHSVHG